jgi:hypothetical protein
LARTLLAKLARRYVEKAAPTMTEFSGDAADAKAAALKRRFQNVTRRIERRVRLRRLIRLAKRALPFFIVAVAATYAAMNSPWPIMATVKHLASFPNCEAVRAMGLAPAYRGNPGYWLRHDADNDGIACEPPPWIRLHSR